MRFNAGALCPNPRRCYNSALRILRVLALAYLGVLLVMMFLEESLVFVPTRLDADPAVPADLAVENAWFQSADGTKLHGWYVRHEHPRAVVLFCHGNGGNITHRTDVLRLLNRRVGVSALIFDYRGYGRSEGEPNERGVLADARAARDWLARREKMPEDQIVLMGESIGGAVAVDLAVDGARALIIENSFSSLPDVAAYHYPLLPVQWCMRTRLNSAAKIGGYHGPLLQSHGERDTIVPIRLGLRLFEAANEPKRFLRFPGRDHNDGRPPGYYDTLRDFLDSCPAG